MPNSTPQAGSASRLHIPAASAGEQTTAARHYWSGDRLAEYLAVAWTLAVAAGLFVFFRSWGFDDPYITYRYADNLAQGLGFVYNAGERVLSTTTPLYTLLLSLIRLAGVTDLPLASNALGCISFAAGGWALWRLGRAWGLRSVGAIALLLYPTFPLFMPTLGAETGFYIALILLAFLMYAEGRYLAAAILLALATVTRADGVLAGTVVAGAFLLAKRRPIPWRAVFGGSVLVGLWFGFAWFYFGAPFPVTLAAKQQQAQLMGSESFATGFVALAGSFWRQPLYRAHFVFAAAGLVYALLDRRRFLLVPAWNVLYFAAYVLLGVTRYHWYYAPLVAGFATLVALGIAVVGRAVGRVGGRRIGIAAITGLTLLALVPQLGALAALRQNNDPRLAIYRRVGEWLKANTPADASVGALEVGIMGYYAERRMIDFAGLIQPETAQRMVRATTYEDAAIWAFHRFRPDYLVVQDGLFPRLEHDPAMSGCRQVNRWTERGYNHQLIAYQCAS